MKTKFRSFSGRLTRRIIFVMLLTMMVVSGLILLFTTSGTVVLINSHYEDVLKLTGERVEGVMNVVEMSTANNIDEIRQQLSQPELVEMALENELRLNPHIVGCGVGFIPDYYRGQGRWFEPYASREEGGGIQVAQIGSASHDYLQADWFLNGLEAENGYWTDPYFDEAGAKEMLCSYAMPVKDEEGRTVGVFGADVSLTWLTELVQGIGREAGDVGFWDDNLEENDPYAFIIGRNGDYLAHPDPTCILDDNIFNRARESGDEKYELLGREMVAGRSGHGQVRLDGVKSYVYYAPLTRTDWSMAIAVPLSSVVEPGIFIASILLSLLLAGLLVAFFLCQNTVSSASRPLKQLARSAEEVAQGHFDTPLPEIKYNDEIRQLRDSFDDMQHSLTNYISELTTATEHRVSMERELGIAREIQMSMLPKDYPDREDVDIAGRQKPALTVGGDLYDFFILDDALYFCIGDVSGKGVPASLVMAVTSTQFRSLGQTESRPEHIVQLLNQTLCARNDSLMFVTLFVGVLHLDTGVLDYCNAGHDAPLLVGADGSVRLLDVQPNLALGVEPDQEFVAQRIVLKPGSLFFLYTDGLNEAENPDHDQFGLDRILDTAQKAGPASPAALLDTMTSAVHGFVSGAEQSDDLTMLAIKRLKK